MRRHQWRRADGRPHSSDAPERPARLVTTVLVALVIAVAAGPVLLMQGSGWFWISDVADLFRPWWAAVAVVALLLGMVLRRWGLSMLALVVVALAVYPLGAEVVGRAPARAQDGLASLPGRHLTIVTYNVLGSRASPGSVLTWLRAARPDVIAMQEFPPSWTPQLHPLRDIYPYTLSDLGTDTRDLEVYSKYPLVDVQPFAPTQDGRVAATVQVAQQGGPPWRLLIAHPNTLQTKAEWVHRRAYVDATGNWVALQPQAAPTLAVGDWNTPPWSPLLRDFEARTGLRRIDTNLVPAPTRWLAHLGQYYFGSPIDHVLVGPAVRAFDCDIAPPLGSDHRPVICCIRR